MTLLLAEERKAKRAATARAWQVRNPEKVREASRRWYAKHTEKALAAAARARETRDPQKHREDALKWYYQNAKKVRGWNLKRMYGITLEQWEVMFEAQGRCCAICKTKEAKRGWHVDHCHKTKKVRGILCPPCNYLLGNVKDNENTLLSAIAYLKESV